MINIDLFYEDIIKKSYSRNTKSKTYQSENNIDPPLKIDLDHLDFANSPNPLTIEDISDSESSCSSITKNKQNNNPSPNFNGSKFIRKSLRMLLLLVSPERDETSPSKFKKHNQERRTLMNLRENSRIIEVIVEESP